MAARTLEWRAPCRAKGTIYRHFADNHALFHEVSFSVMSGMGDELRRLPERAGQGTVRGNLEPLFGLLGALQERSMPLMASMWAGPEPASSFDAHVQDNALEGFELTAPVATAAAHIRAEQELGRIRGDVDATEATAAAAAIMAAVFGCFLVAEVLELKELGFALAVAVILDATIVRLLLAPAIMKVAGGGANWWLPGILRRILPEVKVE